MTLAETISVSPSVTTRVGAAASARPALMSETDLAEVLGAFNDVTSRLQASHEALRGEVARLQNELRDANEQLERSRRLAALGEMAAGIAHEVRNPLGSIRLYARMLESDLSHEPASKELAVKIGSGVRVVDAVVRDVLAFAREARVQPEFVEIDALVSNAIEEALAADRADAGEAARQIRVDRRDRLSADGSLVKCDPALTHRALANVVANATQAMRDAASRGDPTEMVLTIDVERRLTGRRSGAAMAITVSDTGPGIAPEVIDRIFNPFFTTRAAGTGLGLAIVHRIMDAHGGSVAVRNREVGRGAVVELGFPASPEASGTGRRLGGRGVGTEAGVTTGALRKTRVRENAA